jgi:hypothetical protein
MCLSYESHKRIQAFPVCNWPSNLLKICAGGDLTLRSIANAVKGWTVGLQRAAVGRASRLCSKEPQIEARMRVDP